MVKRQLSTALAKIVDFASSEMSVGFVQVFLFSFLCLSFRSTTGRAVSRNSKSWCPIGSVAVSISLAKVEHCKMLELESPNAQTTFRPLDPGWMKIGL